MSWLKRDSPFRSSLRGKLAASISAMTSATASSATQQSSSSTLIESSVEHDADACFDSFKNHWNQAWETMCRLQTSVLTPRSVMVDQISGVLNHLDQLVSLLLHDLRRPNDDNDLSIGPLLDLVLTEDILGRLLSWSLRTGEFVDALKLEQLKLYEALVAQSVEGRVELLVHKPILQPLLRLLSACGERGAAPIELERRLVVLLNQLCVSFTRNPTLLEFFFNASPSGCELPPNGPANFLIFSLLIPFVHREGAIGQQARDALLLCMSLSQEHEGIGLYIAQHSTFCPVLATGLSGLYSLLPRKLAIEDDSDWHCFTPDDIQELPELGMFLNSLEFCNAVVQVAHSLVQEQLLEYLNHGFLLPVLIPALQPSLQQPCVRELTAATAYLDLFIRTITEPSLLQAFFKMLLLDSSEGPSVIHDLIRRIACQQPLSVVTLALFQTLLNLNCEDVMLELVFKHLIPCTHVMVSQRCRVREIDMFGKTAEKFLSLTPASCLPPTDVDTDDSSLGSAERDGPHSIPGTLPRTIERRRRRLRSSSSSSLGPSDLSDVMGGGCTSHAVLQTSFLEYLLDARHSISSCVSACRCWAWSYDGEQPPPDALSPQQPPTNPSSALNGMFNASAMKTSENGDTDNNDRFRCEKSSSASPQSKSSNKSLSVSRSSRTAVNERDCRNVPPAPLLLGPSPISPFMSTTMDGFGSPDLGPFLSMLLTKLENMMSNSVYENLQLTGVISRLACYPQPLLRSFLLNHSLVFQPSVRSLLQVLGTLKQKLDSFFYTEENVDDLMLRARRFLAMRDERITLDNGPIRKRPVTSKMEHRCSSNSVTANTEGNGRAQENKRRSIAEMLFGKSPLNAERERSKSSAFFDAIPNDTGYRYVKASPTSDSSADGKLESLRTKNAVLCMVILEEFLKELSAIAMEHAVLWDDEPNVEYLFQ